MAFGKPQIFYTFYAETKGANNLKVKKMRRKISTLIAAITIVLLTVTATLTAFQMYPAKVYGQVVPSDSVTVSPPSLTLTTLPETYTYWVNVTSTGTASTDYINNVDIELPTGWANAAGAAAFGYGFGVSVAADGWVNCTTALGTFYGGVMANFSIPVTISLIPPTTGTWTVYCFEGATPSTSNPVTVTVTVNLEFYATMTPDYVMNGTSYIYTITVVNTLCPIGINTINMTFPAGTWIFNVLIEYSPLTWTVGFNGVNTFYLGPSPSILETYGVTILVNMTVPESAGAPWYYYWNVSAWSSSSAFLGTYSIQAVVDNTRPVVSIIAPNEPYYSVGAGNYMWINASVSDTPSMATFFSQYDVTTNDSRFTLYSVTEVGTSNTFDYCWENNTFIPDGTLNVLITAVDPAGNVGTGLASTTVDNTAPRLLWIYVVDQNDELLYTTGNGIYWMSALTTNVSVEAAFYSQQTAGPAGVHGDIYFNTSMYPFVNDTTPTTPGRWMPGAIWMGTSGYYVTGSNLITLNITLLDSSSPTANRYTYTWTIKREITPPSVPSYTKTQTICGGFIIWGLTATDAVGISSYNIMLNGSSEPLYPYELNSAELWYFPNDYVCTVQNITVVDLYYLYSPGDVANITITAVNYGSNVGPPLTFLVTVQAGEWAPIEMFPKWNLISFPLIPSSTTTANIYSLLLVNGASGVTVTYGYNTATSTWTVNPTSMSDGNGYWVNMNAYDVLIVQGYSVGAPPSVGGAPPAIVEYSLTTGWNLAGFTEYSYNIYYDGMWAPFYVASLQYTSTLATYFRFVYTWDPVNQGWQIVDLYTDSPFSYYFYPGQAFWIYMYNSQTLIPPIPY
jgi:hypothetical protein